MGETAKPGVLVTDARVMPYASRLADSFTVIDGSRQPPGDAEAATVIAILSAGADTVDAALINRLPGLRMIATPAIGTNGIDLEAARARGVVVTNGGDTHSGDVAAHAVALTLAARGRVMLADDWVRSGRWGREGAMPLGRCFGAERVGIVGMGNIGQGIARRIAGLCPDIGWWAPRPQNLSWPRHESLMALAEWSSILILAARGDPSNTGMISAEVIDAIGPEGLFVNVARGFMVDEDALIDALKAGRLGQAALDVFAEEPADPARWQDVPNTLLSPHSGGLSFDAARALATLVCGNIRTLLTGAEPHNIVVDGRTTPA